MTLVQLFTAIANAIRAKTGSSETIKAEDFPTEINSIPSGGGYPPDWSEIGYTNTPASIIEAFNYSKEIQEDWDESLTSLSNKFKNDTNLMYMPLINTTNVKYMSNTFNSCTKLEIIPLLDTSNVIEMSSAFYGCSNLKLFPLLDISKVKFASSMFVNCSKLIAIPNLNTVECTNMQMMFYNCKQLTTIPVLNTSKVTNMNNTFGNCSSLSNESLNNIIAMCIGATSYAGTKTLKYIGLSSAQATTCQSLSNWSAFTSAGWTTGY